MLKMFTEPVKITIREYYIHKEHRSNWHLVQRFEYGDDDNWITAILDDIKISGKTMFNTETRDNYYGWLDCYYVSAQRAEKDGYLNASRDSFLGCTSVGKDKLTIKDYLDTTIIIDGIFVEDRFIKEGDVYEVYR